MDKIAITRQPSPGAQIGSDSYDGLFEISHLTQADLFLPTLVKLASSDANDSQHLDLLFPLHSIADFLLEQPHKKLRAKKNRIFFMLCFIFCV